MNDTFWTPQCAELQRARPELRVVVEHFRIEDMGSFPQRLTRPTELDPPAHALGKIKEIGTTVNPPSKLEEGLRTKSRGRRPI